MQEPCIFWVGTRKGAWQASTQFGAGGLCGRATKVEEGSFHVAAECADKEDRFWYMLLDVMDILRSVT